MQRPVPPSEQHCERYPSVVSFSPVYAHVILALPSWLQVAVQYMPPEPAKVRSEQGEDMHPMLFRTLMWQLQLVGAQQLPPLSWFAPPERRVRLPVCPVNPCCALLGLAPAQGKHRLLFLLYKQSGCVTVKPPAKRQGFQVGLLRRALCGRCAPAGRCSCELHLFG